MKKPRSEEMIIKADAKLSAIRAAEPEIRELEALTTRLCALGYDVQPDAYIGTGASIYRLLVCLPYRRIGAEPPLIADNTSSFWIPAFAGMTEGVFL